MAESHVLYALKRKYSRALGRLKYEPEAQLDLIHLGYVIRMFSPAEDLKAIRPTRVYAHNRRRWLRHVLAALRAAEKPLGGREIARRVLRSQGLPEDLTRVLSISSGLATTLGKMAEKGWVKVEGKPRKWSLAPRP
jgi:hypothetical protein